MKNENMKGLDVKISDRIARLSEEKRSLLLERLKKTEIGQKNKIPKRNGTEEAIPLSFSQERLWFLSQLESESVFYNEAGAVELVGKLDVHALEQSLQEIIRRHEVLRTIFIAHEGRVQQHIVPELKVALGHKDLQMLSSHQRIDETKQCMIDEANRPFDLSSGPLIRFLLIQLTLEKQVLVVVLHHIIADGWSVKILVHELSAIYSAFCTGRPSPLPELPIQYADYACWQREWMQDSVLNKQLDYWKKHLQGSPSLLELPTDFPRPTKLKHFGAKYRFNISRETTAALSQLGKNHGVTLFMTLAAAYAVLLSRYTHQKDICIGYPIVNRSHSELQVLIGFFANTLMQRIDLSGNPSFTELLVRVKKECLEAQAHQDLPFEKLVEELAPERMMSHNPLFQVFLNQASFDEQLRMPGIEMTEVEVEMGSSKFDLTLDVREKNGALTGWFEYNIQLFKESTIARWTGHLQQLLQNVAVIADRPISTLLILSEQEREQLLFHWNATSKVYPHDLCIHQLIEEQAELQPNSVAVVFEDQSLTYHQLNAKANQLAHFLRAQGVGPEVLVGICVERSLEMIIGLLGTLKANGAYVPIDPRYPSEHIAHMLEDAKLQIVLTQESFQGLLPVQTKRIILDVQQWVAREENTDNLINVISSKNLAYIIYTSGSTGKPKGVGVTHRNVVYSTLARLDYYQVPINSFLLLSSIAFDSSVAGIFGTLCQGGRLVLPLGDAVFNPVTLVNMILSQEISHLLTVPSLYESILQQISFEKGKSLRQVIVAGESCKKSLVELQNTRLPHVELFNEYGPTEATVWSSVYQCEVNNDTVVPVGRPTNNTRIFLLDAYLNPVPIGVIGELYIAGEGLARGYLNRTDVTADCYIPDPFGESGNRLYRTGDLARYREDGNIEYVGRADHQVKIRGFRVELGGIESKLLQHPSIRDAVVIAREDTPGNKRLVAYVVVDRLEKGADDIRSYLAERLPGYMLPTAFIFLDQLPLSANRKVDRKALPAPDINAQSICQYVAPRSQTEANLVAIWAEVLGLDRISIHDNFFELGGHSLLVIQVISRVCDIFSIDLPLNVLFEKPVLEEFALEIDATRMEEKEFEVFPLRNASRNQALPLSHAQERLWFLEQFEPGNTTYNMSGAVRLIGELDIDVLEKSLNEIIRRHEVLRTIFSMVDGRPEQVIATSMVLRMTRVDLQDVSQGQHEAEIRRYQKEEAQQPFDLSEGPLVRASLLSLGRSSQSGEAEYILLFTLHHIVSDGWSTAILIREFITLYEAYRAGRVSSLSELTIQYADYAIWQREWLQGKQLEQQVDYWKQCLAGAPAVTELPTDRPRPVVQSYRGTSFHFAIPHTVTEQLKILCLRQDVTLFMLLLAAFNVLLSRYNGNDDLCVGTPVANRNRLEIEGLIGFFVNTLVLRTDLSGNPTFLELLKRVRKTCLGAQAHQDLPFEKLVEELAPVRDMGHHPLFQVMLALQNIPETALEIEGLRIVPELMEVGTSKFDLDLEISERNHGLEIQFSYNTDLFDESTIMRMAEHYGVLLQNIVAAPDRLLSELQILTESERDRLLIEWDCAEADYPREKRIHELFEAQAVKTPDAIAVVYEGTQLTYAELNRRSNRLAHYLRSQGVGPEKLVGICVERSLEIIIGVLGILKAGGAYLPIDPELPSGRLRLILQDANTRWVLTLSKLIEQIPEFCSAICLDQDIKGGKQLDENLLDFTFDERQLAYMLYTSGTTGLPKGVGVHHGNLVNQYFAWRTAYALRDSHVHLQMARYTFDVFAGDWIRALCSGGKLVICPGETLLQPMQLYALMQRELVTVAEFVPAVLRSLAEYLEESGQRLLFMQLLICGSDRWYVEEYRNLLKLCGQHTRLINSYGLTEATIDSTYFETRETQFLTQELVPIGQRFTNTYPYVLDRWLNPTPMGVPGELYIGGTGVVRGYFNRPELTAERFIPNPFSQKFGERLYKTGDVVRCRPDGNIEHLGRTDHQVKIRGFRIELGEIEAMLLRHPYIKETVVVARNGDMPCNQHLVAYVVGNEVECSNDDLRMYLKEYLSDYMLPAVFVWLDCLPLNTNGKVDRKALPAPDVDTRFDHQYVAPRTHTEEAIATIWEEVLGLERVGIYDDFFELGGHSLLVTQIISRIFAKLHIKIPIRAVFEAATVADLAKAVEVAQWVEASDSVEMISKDLAYEDIAI